MARIVKAEVLMVDLVPKVTRTDAIQSFVSQETPIVRLTDEDVDGVAGDAKACVVVTVEPQVAPDRVSLLFLKDNHLRAAVISLNDLSLVSNEEVSALPSVNRL